MTYEISYENIADRKERDEKAIQDIKDYLSPELWDIMMELIEGPHTIKDINMSLAFAGVSGYPFHAFCRKYSLEKYREWMQSPNGGEPVIVDEQGFS